MSTGFKSFHQLFLDAETFTDPNHGSTTLKQNDTSFFDEAVDGDSDTRKLKLAEPGLTALLKQAYRIRQDRNTGKEAKRVIIDADGISSTWRHENTTSIPLPHEVPSLNWESVMNFLVSDAGLKPENLALMMAPFRQLRLDDIAPPFCFDPDIISIGEAFGFERDPLNALIPNVSLAEDMYLMDLNRASHDNLVGTMGTMASSGTVAGGGADKGNKEAKDAATTYGDIDTSEGVRRSEEPQTMSKEERDRLMMEEKVRRITNLRVGGGEAAAAAVVFRTQGAKRPRDDIPKARNRFKATVSALNHALIASTHRNTKMDLTVAELRNIHRPRFSKALKMREWEITILNLPKKKDLSTSLSAGRLAGVIEPLTDMDRQDMSLSRGDFICIEYVEENPPILLNIGMASAVLNYYRSNDHRDAEERTQRRRCEELQKAVSSSSRRVPRHVQLLLQRRSQKLVYDSTANVPRLEFGETKILTPDDEAPFLGDVEEGEIIQALVNNVFRAPIFRHRPLSTDFLLIRLKQSNKATSYVVREIPRVFVCGQLEPQKIVPRPSRNITKLQEKMILLAASRFFRATPHGAGLQAVKESLLKFYGRKACFHGAQGLARIIRDKVAEEVRVDGERRWFPKSIRGGPNGDKMADELEKLEKDFSPEDVCLQESCNAAELRLLDHGIGDVDLSRVRLWLQRMKRLKDFKIDRAAYVKLLINSLKREAATGSMGELVPSSSSSSSSSAKEAAQMAQAANNLLRIVVSEIRLLEEKIEIAQHAYERLLVAPWNTTEAFVHSQVERDGNGRIELTGQGDPSGKGEGFAYVRLVKQVDAVKKTAEKLVHTDKDLRKLTRKDLHTLLRGFGLPDADIKSLKRWDMVHLVREHSTKAESKGISTAMHKYARSVTGHVLNESSGLGEAFKQRCQEIWDRQKCALAHFSLGYVDRSNSRAAETEDNEFDDDDDDDDDWGSQLGAAEDINRTIARRAAKLQEEEASSRDARAAARAKEEQRELGALRGTAFFATLGAGGSGTGTGNGGTVGTTAVLKPATTAATVSAVIEGSASTARDRAIAAVPSPHPVLPATGLLPRRVVKQVVRTVAGDGAETVEVRFLLSADEVWRVEKKTVLQQREREQRAIEEAIGAGADVVFDEEDDALLKLSVADLKIKLSSLKKRTSTEEDDFGQMRRKGLGPSSAVNRAAKARSREELELAQSYKPLARTTARAASSASAAGHRMPHVRFAAKLEKELLAEWHRPHSLPFLAPVPRAVPDYYEKIAQPICLADIREKIASYQYSTVQAVEEDLNLLVSNAETFNGAASKIAIHARSLRTSLMLALTHDRKHLGADTDEFSILETAMRKKYARWKRASPGLPPNLISARSVPPLPTSVCTSVDSSAPSATTSFSSSSSALSSSSVMEAVTVTESAATSMSNSAAVAMAMDVDGSDASSSGDEEVLEQG